MARDRDEDVERLAERLFVEMWARQTDVHSEHTDRLAYLARALTRVALDAAQVFVTDARGVS